VLVTTVVVVTEAVVLVLGVVLTEVVVGASWVVLVAAELLDPPHAASVSATTADRRAAPSLIRWCSAILGIDPAAVALRPTPDRDATIPFVDQVGRQPVEQLGQQTGEDSLPGRPYPPPAAKEPLWPALVAILFAIGLQLLLPKRVTAGPRWLLPSLEAVLLIALMFASPRELEGPHAVRRRLALSLTALVSAANITSLTLLAHELLHHNVTSGRGLIVAGSLIWLTNVIIFGLWYWETDRGGAGMRAAGCDGPPDFLFPQMNDDRIQPPNWRPQFIDYLYVSLTNAVALSPTDTMPLSRTAKSIMGVQSLVSLVTIGLIISRAVNILQ
jgi:hypothetical protein